MQRDESQNQSRIELPAQPQVQSQEQSQSKPYKPRKGNYWQRQRRSSLRGTAEQPGSWVDLLKSLSFLTASSLSLVTVLLLLNMVRSGTGFLGKIFGVVTAPQPAPQVDVRSAVVQQVRGVSELTTAIFVMETVVPTSRERTISGLVVGKTTLLYIGYGEVRAGLDLSSLTADAVQTQGDSLLLRLPPPRILDSKIDVNRSKVYDYDRGFMGMGPDVAPELQDLAQRKTLERLIQSACSQGLLQTANDRARLAISQLLSTTGYRQVTIETQPPTADACPPPAPELPSGNPAESAPAIPPS
ncbi:DUF4230 domain-containing protein [Leptolyngbya sp. FACHB-711]|uniref:DUF4230 domain-containing protein n=1 Tax=unclassified Leptolyngbya TaxID=2650499 RepID=UPI00168350EE|nr:DUF4230 domain-containing protein [Leptolyngbya sp. FACHB-711]MBD1852253.1 DUF4230 domain-containing protein [Cyanobacteria bacterium FACHB-502]MBD2023384.1 DUF4230 domain-containing protein [Leptolyngbya sp. FACHB-711]